MRADEPGSQGGLGPELTALERALSARLYRFDCPSAHTLGEFYLGVLEATCARTVDEHLRTCLACCAELRSLQVQLDG
jgi:hypothetical protein